MKEYMYSRSCFIFMFSLAVLSSLCFASCGNRHKKTEDRILQKMQSDSLDLVRQEITLAYTDSLLQTLLPKADSMLRSFRYEKNDTYEDHGHYVYKNLRTESNIDRCYIQAWLTDDYRTVVRSIYVGSSELSLAKMTLTADSLSNTWSAGRHHFFTDRHYETLSFQDDEALQILGFIDMSFSQLLCVVLEGSGGKYRYYMSRQDKEYLVETYRLGVLMRDIAKLEEQLAQTSAQVQKHQKRIEKDKSYYKNLVK